ncbi:DUF2971 domain-containing protein [Pandoraea sputorum]|uniref:DUF2971 domain-containing protein n=1 Tax=Pandoraea sputorum TaxID=93222 RepID=UPI002AF6BF39|nr:DUF2971 domain-containing protein [Pandoraea sputorum]
MLYKYFALGIPGTTDGNELLRRLERMLSAGEVYFSSPERFNDPFDCNPKIVVPDRRSKPFIDSFTRSGERHGRSIGQIAQDYRERLKLPDAEWVDKVTQLAIARIRAVGVLCVTPKRDNPLMWAHYANCHTGICVGFHRSGALMDAQSVRYAGNVRPEYDHVSGTTDQFYDVFFRKANCWAYEEEQRLVSMDIGPSATRKFAADKVRNVNEPLARFMEREPGPGTFELGPDAVGEVVMGYGISEANRNSVLELVRNSGKNIGIFECRLHDNEYVMEVIPVT